MSVGDEVMCECPAWFVNTFYDHDGTVVEVREFGPDYGDPGLDAARLAAGDVERWEISCPVCKRVYVRGRVSVTGRGPTTGMC